MSTSEPEPAPLAANAAASGVIGAPAGEPILPSPRGPCPEFKTGSQVVQGLRTDMLVGEPIDTKGPLLIAWHGTNKSGAQILSTIAPIHDEIVAQGGLIIAPNDSGAKRYGPSPNGVWYERSDLYVVDHIVACAVAHHNVDPHRIYTYGCSAGGLMAAVLATRRSSYIAAATPSSGGLVPGLHGGLSDPSRVPAVMTLHGGVDDTVIVNFETTSHTLDDIVVAAGGFAVDCNHRNGHCGIEKPHVQAMWAFMQAHRFGQPSPYADGLPSDFPASCEIHR